MKVKAFLCQHKGEKIEDCEDRFCVNHGTGSVAVADGMSQSFLQAYWADLLCRHFCESTDWAPTQENLRDLKEKWLKLRDGYAEREEKKGTPYLFLINNAIAEGQSAGSTFAGIRTTSANTIHYHVLGDSCIVHFRDGKLQSVNDIISSQKGGFDCYPDFFDSSNLRVGTGAPVSGDLTIADDDTILIVSDPFSDFFYEKVTGGNDCANILQQILKIELHEDYEHLVKELRDKGMHDDDSTLIVLQPDRKEELSIEYEDPDPDQSLFDGKTSKIIGFSNEAIPDEPVKESEEEDEKRMSDDNQRAALQPSGKPSEMGDKLSLPNFGNKILGKLDKHKDEEHTYIDWLIIFAQEIKSNLGKTARKIIIKILKR